MAIHTVPGTGYKYSIGGVNFNEASQVKMLTLPENAKLTTRVAFQLNGKDYKTPEGKLFIAFLGSFWVGDSGTLGIVGEAGKYSLQASETGEWSPGAPQYQGDWETPYVYTLNMTVHHQAEDGYVRGYICTQAHTSGAALDTPEDGADWQDYWGYGDSETSNLAHSKKVIQVSEGTNFPFMQEVFGVFGDYRFISASSTTSSFFMAGTTLYGIVVDA